jgi:predicted DNA-binding transcriptional regulator YafY
MCTIKYIERLERIDQFIRQQRTGTAYEFAEKMGISRRQLYNLLDELKDLGLPVMYSRSTRTFMYEYNCRLKINIEVLELENAELSYYEGGIRKIVFSLTVEKENIQNSYI